MEFFEDLGGFFGIMYTFGVIANFLFVCKGSPSLQYLTHFYEDSRSRRKHTKADLITASKSVPPL